MQAKIRDFALEVYFSKWEFAARYNITASDVQSLALQELLEMATPEDRHAFENLHLGYTETFGLPALLDAIAQTYERISSKNLLCFAGAEEGIYTAMRVLLSAEDHVIVITPNYQAAESIPLDICEVTGVALDIERDWELDVDAVRDAIRPNTRLLSLNFPNNPTGKILPRESYDALIDICRERGIWIFNDEVYRLIESDPAIRLPQIADVYERGISLNVMSKAYGLPGLRIGWLACQDRDLLVQCEHYKHYLSICNSAPSEILALIGLKARERILTRNRAIVNANLMLMDTFFAQYPERFAWKRPDGSCVAFVRYRGKDGVEKFCSRLVEEAGVLLLPSSIYHSELGPVPQDCFRIGFGRSFVADGLSAMDDWLQQSN